MTARPASIVPSEPTAQVHSPTYRVAVASSGLGHVARGVEAWAADLARSLAARGMDVTLCKGGGTIGAPYEKVIGCTQRGSHWAKRLSRVLPQCLGWRLGVNSTYGVEQATFAMNLLWFLRSEPIDVLHVQDPRVAMIVQRANAMGLVRTRTILAHGTEEPAGFLRNVKYLQHLAPWHEVESRRAAVSNPSWTVIPNFIDTDRFSPRGCGTLRQELGIPGDAIVVLTAAAIKKKHKRIDVLIDEFARVRAERPDLPLWLVIAGGEEADTREIVDYGKLILGDRVRFLVRFPRERMADLYRCADVFVLNSLKEMMPIAVLEAAASGLPCIVNDHPVLTWMIGPGGEAIDLATPGVLADSLLKLLSDPDRRRRLGLVAREHCIRNFGEQVVVDQVLAYYETVLADTTATAGRPHPADRAAVPTDTPSRFLEPAKAGETVSVVIPTFNSAAWVTQAIDSVLTQTVAPAEIIVVDDGSTDDTRQRLQPYMDRIRYVLQSNGGVASARNHGIGLATGSLIAFLDADDVWHPRKLELQLDALSQQPELSLLGTMVYDWPNDAMPDASCSSTKPVVVPWRRLVVKNGFTTSSVVVRRRALEAVGGFDTSLHGPEDYDLWLRIAEQGSVANIAAPLVGYRTVPGSLGRRVRTMEDGLQRILRKLDDRSVWRGRWLLRRKAHSFFSYSCAYQHLEAGNPQEALQRLLSSLASYPMPYRRSEVRMPFARARMLTMIVRKVLSAPKTPSTA